jgi:hypothetical protein
MEAANEAARRAVNGILDAAGAAAVRCSVWPLYEPEIFAPWRELDFIRYAQGLPWDDTLVRLGISFVDLTDKAIVALEGATEAHDLYKSHGVRTPMPYKALVSLVDRQEQFAGTSDLRREAMTLVERIVRTLALRFVEAQAGAGISGSTPTSGSGRVQILPR